MPAAASSLPSAGLPGHGLLARVSARAAAANLVLGVKVLDDVARAAGLDDAVRNGLRKQEHRTIPRTQRGQSRERTST